MKINGVIYMEHTLIWLNQEFPEMVKLMTFKLYKIMSEDGTFAYYKSE